MSEPEKKEQRRPCSPEMLTPSMLLNDVSHLIRNKMRREGEASGMRQGYRRIMFHLAHGDDGGTQQDLVRRTKLSAPTISVALNRMEAEGLVKRQPDERDMRVTRVFLTEKGRQLNENMQRLVQEVEDDVRGDLSEEEIAQFKSTLLKIRQRLIEKGGSLDEKTR